MAKPEQADEREHEGVQRLIDRIRSEAVEAGRSEAAAIVEQARREAAAILASAQRERDELQRKTRAELEVEKQAAHAAVHAAARDVMLSLKASLVAAFQAHVGRLVSESLHEPELIRQLVLALAGRVADEALAGREIDVLVAALLTEPHADAPLDPRVRDTILGISRELLREGVQLHASPKIAVGAKVVMVGESLEIDLGDAAITAMLCAYLTPRFRWILDGTQ